MSWQFFNEHYKDFPELNSFVIWKFYTLTNIFLCPHSQHPAFVSVIPFSKYDFFISQEHIVWEDRAVFLSVLLIYFITISYSSILLKMMRQPFYSTLLAFLVDGMMLQGRWVFWLLFLFGLIRSLHFTDNMLSSMFSANPQYPRQTSA